MITFQSYSQTPSVLIFLDSNGIEEMISYLTFLKNKDASMHLNIGNELDEEPIDEDLTIVPHIKIVNVDKLDKVG